MHQTPSERQSQTPSQSYLSESHQHKAGREHYPLTSDVVFKGVFGDAA